MNAPPASTGPDHTTKNTERETMSTDSTTATVMRGSCACGANTFEVTAGVPMQRFYCHCLYCQQFMGKPYTDVTFVRAKNVVIHAEHATFANPKLLPPGFAHGRGSRFGHPDKGRFAKCAPLDRAHCDKCGDPFIETIGGSAGMVFIPSKNFANQDALPPVQRHIYYRLREQDVADELPKHHYYASSQLAIAAMISRVLRRG
ncbi:hypothetical protein J7E25_13580 [Agromyces sp. ISL-38]|uniref:GFA family protein n=1 Tax=Agromyces sp. ISL-38 TaxID=2819107 RepID=UPI001BE78FC3|nr:hypothetical protein [Agromyces sp. ISL-38]MBT2500118.1 hypothetical protein [Agromyces sp. ISL-38]MBT2516785.1 hypothetical protein [Streptomyces sp. ISL-90]